MGNRMQEYCRRGTGLAVWDISFNAARADHMAKHGKKPSGFPETQWSLVNRARASDEQTRQKALDELLRRYLPALRAFLIGARRLPPDTADDVLQGFVTDKVLKAGLIRQAEQHRGKFRNFVLKSLNNFATTKLQRERRHRGRGGDVDGESYDPLSELKASSTEVDRFDQEWLQQVVRDALESMEKDCHSRGRGDMWEVLRLRVVAPLLDDSPAVEYAQLVQRFELQTPRQVINLLANAKRCFLTHLRAAVARYAGDEEQIEREMVDLRTIVGR
jgi:hypothetical protein